MTQGSQISVAPTSHLSFEVDTLPSLEAIARTDVRMENIGLRWLNDLLLLRLKPWQAFWWSNKSVLDRFLVVRTGVVNSAEIARRFGGGKGLGDATLAFFNGGKAGTVCSIHAGNDRVLAFVVKRVVARWRVGRERCWSGGRVGIHDTPTGG